MACPYAVNSCGGRRCQRPFGPQYRPQPGPYPVAGRAINGEIRCAANNGSAAAAAAASEAMRRQQYIDPSATAQPAGPCAARVDSVSAQLYGARPLESPAQTVCCDPLFGCGQYRLDSRDSFWPSFAHPRWLSCERLYGHGAYPPPCRQRP